MLSSAANAQRRGWQACADAPRRVLRDVRSMRRQAAVKAIFSLQEPLSVSEGRTGRRSRSKKPPGASSAPGGEVSVQCEPPGPPAYSAAPDVHDNRPVVVAFRIDFRPFFLHPFVCRAVAGEAKPRESRIIARTHGLL